MKLLKLLGATVVSVCAFAGSALAGQAFDVTFSNPEYQFPTATIGNIDYKHWYPRDISAGGSFSGFYVKLLTEHCAAFFGCGSNKGDKSLARDGILWSLMVGSSIAVNFCISHDGPVSTTCGVVGSGGSQLTSNNWIAGCYVPGGGYTCTVTQMYKTKNNGRITIIYTLGLPSSMTRQ